MGTEEYYISEMNTNRLIGKYRIKNSKIQYKENGKYTFKECRNISNLDFYNEFEAMKMTIAESFNGVYQIYQCKEYKSLLLFNKDEKKVLKYSPSISCDDLTAIITNLSFSQRSF